MTSSDRSWIVVECPACQTPLKAPAGAETHRLQCPGCGCFVRIGDEIGGGYAVSGTDTAIPVRRGLSILPTMRTVDPDFGSVRGREREEWEPYTALHPPPFTGPVHSTLEADFRTDPDAAQKERRLRRRDDEKLQWEEEPTPVAQELPGVRLERIYKFILATLIVLALALMFGWGMKTVFHRGAGTLERAWLAATQKVAALREEEEGSPSNPRTYAAVTEGEHEEAVAVMKKFLTASTVDEILSVVREPERVEPLLRAYYRETPLRPVTYRRLPHRSELQNYKNFLVGSAEGPDFESRILAVQRSPRPMKVDWETFVGHCEVPWEKLSEVRPTTPTLLRVRLSLDDYFNYAFSDEAKWQCFRLSSLRDDHQIYGYALRASPLALELDRRARLNRLAMVAVRIKFPEGSTSRNQAEVTDLVSDGWLINRHTIPIATSNVTPARATREPAIAPPKPAETPAIPH